MELTECLRLAAEGLRTNKMRAILTMLGIIIGIAAVIGILTVGNGLSGEITGTMSTMGASSITVSLQEKKPDYDFSDVSSMMSVSGPADADLMSLGMIEAMQERYADEITAVSLTRSIGSGQAKDGRLYANVSLSGVNGGYFTANDIDLTAGRLIRDKDDEGQRMVAVVSDRLVKNMFGGKAKDAVGSELSVEVNGESYRFRIIGVYKYEASAFSISMAAEEDVSTSLYLPLSTARHLAGSPEGFSYFTVQADADHDSAGVARDISTFLNRYYKNNEDYGVFALSMESMIETVNSMMDKLSIAISVIAAISLLVGGIGVMNIMLVSVTERTREIGTRKALGATNGNIRLQFVVESAIICLIGGVIGIILGGILGYVGSSLLDAPSLPRFSSIALAVGFSLAVGIFFGYYPANKAAKLDPIEALRYE